MRATNITIGIPVSDLQAARRWYEKVLDVSEPDLEPVADIVEYQVGACWLQLGLGPVAATGWVFRIGVSDLVGERDRLLAVGVDVDPIEEVEDVLAYCTFSDPDGNQLSLYSLMQEA